VESIDLGLLFRKSTIFTNLKANLNLNPNVSTVARICTVDLRNSRPEYLCNNAHCDNRKHIEIPKPIKLRLFYISPKNPKPHNTYRVGLSWKKCFFSTLVVCCCIGLGLPNVVSRRHVAALVVGADTERAATHPCRPGIHTYLDLINYGANMNDFEVFEGHVHLLPAELFHSYHMPVELDFVRDLSPCEKK